MKSIGISVLINISVPSLKTSIWLNYLVCSTTYNMQCKEKMLTNLHFGILFTLFHSLHHVIQCSIYRLMEHTMYLPNSFLYGMEVETTINGIGAR